MNQMNTMDGAPDAALPQGSAVPPARVWREPTVLTLPDWKGAGAGHWLTQWEQQHGLRRVAQHDWQRPLRGDWMMQLQEAVLGHEQCHLLAHGLGGHLVDAWLRHTQQARRVLSVVLVDPMDLNAQEVREVLFTWKPLVAQAWSVPVAVLWKERQPDAHVMAALRSCGAIELGEAGQALGAGAVAGWSLVEEHWRAQEERALQAQAREARAAQAMASAAEAEATVADVPAPQADDNTAQAGTGD